MAEVATLGGFVRQYQVRLDPNKLRAYNIPLSMVIDRVRDSTNEVGGRLIELGGAEYMIRGMGYLKSLSDLETVPVGNKNGTPYWCGIWGPWRSDRISGREWPSGMARARQSRAWWSCDMV